MCSICEKAQKLPVAAALKLIAAEMKKGRRSACLDTLVGRLAGEELPDFDAEKDGEWEAGRR